MATQLTEEQIGTAINAMEDVRNFVCIVGKGNLALAQHTTRRAMEDCLQPMFGTVSDSVRNQVRHVLDELRPVRTPAAKRLRATLKSSVA